MHFALSVYEVKEWLLKYFSLNIAIAANSALYIYKRKHQDAAQKGDLSAVQHKINWQNILYSQNIVK